MALAINIEDLLYKQKIESNRIEFKKGWNPASIYHSACGDDERTFFRIFIPCHEAAGNIIADIAKKDETLKVSKRSSLKSSLESSLNSSQKSSPKKSSPKIESQIVGVILEQMQNNPRITLANIADITGYSRRWVIRIVSQLREKQIINRIGSNRNGHWEVITEL